MSQNNKFYMTTAIAYASKKPHFGNTYEIIMADAYARYKRAMGYDVFLCTGTDEHGQKIEELAKAEGISPKQYVDRVAGEIRGVWDKMNTTYDYFIRTTDDYHERAVQKIFKRFFEQGDIYKDYYEGWYCTPCESFFTESQITDGKCPDCGRPVHQAKEEAYFFKMSKYVDRLIAHIEANPGFIQPESRKNEMVNTFLKAGLQDLCVSRTSFTWGIPVDFDPKHVTYVWLALIGVKTLIAVDVIRLIVPVLVDEVLVIIEGVFEHATLALVTETRNQGLTLSRLHVGHDVLNQSASLPSVEVLSIDREKGDIATEGAGDLNHRIAILHSINSFRLSMVLL